MNTVVNLPKVSKTSLLWKRSELDIRQEKAIIDTIRVVLDVLNGIQNSFASMSWVGKEDFDVMAIKTDSLPITALRELDKGWLTDIAESLVLKTVYYKTQETGYKTFIINCPSHYAPVQSYRGRVTNEVVRSRSILEDTKYYVYCTGSGGRLITEDLRQINPKFAEEHLQVFDRKYWNFLSERILKFPHINYKAKKAVRLANLEVKRFDLSLEDLQAIHKPEGSEAFVHNLTQVITQAFNTNINLFYYQRLLSSLEQDPENHLLIYQAAVKTAATWHQTNSLEGCSNFSKWTPKRIKKLEHELFNQIH